MVNQKFLRRGQLLEMFATGTAACIVPVSLLLLLLHFSFVSQSKTVSVQCLQVGGLLYKGEMVKVPTPTEVTFSQ